MTAPAGASHARPQQAPRELAASEPEAFWRSLFYFNVYRLTCAITLLVVPVVWSGSAPFGSRDFGLFVSLAACHAVFSFLCFLLIRIRWRFDLQLSTHVGGDIVAIAVLTYASNGISSGLGLLLLTTLAAAGLIARGRLTLF